jgi:hypothetical protein
MVTVEHCPACPAADRPTAVYLTVKEVPVPGMPVPIGARIESAFKPRQSPTLRTVADHVRLVPEEVGALAGSFPDLRSTIGAHPAVLAAEQSAAREIDRAAAVPSAGRTDRLARVETVDPREAGTVLTRGNAVTQTVIALVSGVGSLAMALAPVAALLNIEPRPPGWVGAVALVWMFGWLVFGLVWNLWFARYPTSRFMARRTRHAFELRPNPAVDLNDPDLVFVDIIPRIKWGKAMMENATDIGFLQLDSRRHLLIFEGDRQRYWIPAESILSVTHEFWASAGQHQFQSSPTLNHLVVVRALTAEGPWETWFYRRQNAFRPQTANRRLADALELEAKIRALIGQGA